MIKYLMWKSDLLLLLLLLNAAQFVTSYGSWLGGSDCPIVFLQGKGNSWWSLIHETTLRSSTSNIMIHQIPLEIDMLHLV